MITFPEYVKGPKEEANYLQEGNMVNEYLSQCLDNCRWGSQTTVMYEMSLPEMIEFIQNWRKQNEDNFQDLFHEREIDKKFELPYITNTTCPRNKNHKGTIKDLDRALRCAHIEKLKIKPNYLESYISFDKLADTNRKEYSESRPLDPHPSEELINDIEEETGEPFNFEQYKQDNIRGYIRMERFEQEEPIIVKSPCGAIISDKDAILPLETVIKRLNIRPEFETVYCGPLVQSPRWGPMIIYPKDGFPRTFQKEDDFKCRRVDELDKYDKEMYEITEMCPSHKQRVNKVEFHFDGHTLAHYVQKWYKQLPKGQAPVFED